ncbi:MAG: HupE/UreJ family protein [Myxococcales bacterium]|nr:HupE/UreJ family protein [Myxococcales bacterium]MCH8134064.1 HupE/UreJ family protein [Myxococcales bacterium]
MNRAWPVLGLAVALLLRALPAGAHPMAPALLELREIGEGRVEVHWKTSRFRARGADLRPELPNRCVLVGEIVTIDEPSSRHERWTIDCGSDGLVGETVGVAGLSENRIDALLRVEFADGRPFRSVLRARSPRVAIPEQAKASDVLIAYARMGFEHILSGPDHLLFVFGLVLLVSGLRQLLITITAFTLAHSATLSLAALGIVQFPTGPIEVLIAASVLALAVELARRETHGALAPARLPGLMAGGFGLLHGFGFAGALAEAGLPHGEIPLALLAFNLGIELGQLVFVLIVLVGLRLLGPLLQRLPAWTARIPSYAMGSLAAFWCFDRASALLPFL